MLLSSYDHGYVNNILYTGGRCTVPLGNLLHMFIVKLLLKNIIHEGFKISAYSMLGLTKPVRFKYARKRTLVELLKDLQTPLFCTYTTNYTPCMKSHQNFKPSHEKKRMQGIRDCRKINIRFEQLLYILALEFGKKKNY